MAWNRLTAKLLSVLKHVHLLVEWWLWKNFLLFLFVFRFILQCIYFISKWNNSAIITSYLIHLQIKKRDMESIILSTKMNNGFFQKNSIFRLLEKSKQSTANLLTVMTKVYVMCHLSWNHADFSLEGNSYCIFG